MKLLWIVCGIGLAIVVVVAIYSHLFLTELQQSVDSIEKTYEERAQALRALDRRFPYAEQPRLIPERLATYLAARRPVAEYYAQQTDPPEPPGLLREHEIRNEVLRILEAELAIRRMSLQEYLSITRRWQSLVAGGEPAGLKAAWARVVGDEVPLPAPVMAAEAEELALLRRYEKTVEATLQADLIRPELERIAAEG
ncbi:MAG: hypothetical protein ACYSX0_06375 [Planctomycetota bacterium]|jgi:hypothetical protein